MESLPPISFLGKGIGQPNHPPSDSEGNEFPAEDGVPGPRVY